MHSKRSNRTSESTKNAVNTEPQWVAPDDGEPSAPRVEREHEDDPELDVVQQGPDEVVWAPVEPVPAAEAASASDEPAAKPARAQRKPRAQVATKAPAPAVAQGPDAATSVAQSTEHATSTEPVAKRKPSARAKNPRLASTPPAEPSAPHAAAESKGTLAEQRGMEVATAATEPNAPTPMSKKRKIQEFVTKRGAQRVAEPAEEAAAELADLPPASGVGNLATGSAQDGAHAEAALEPDTSATAAPASTMQPMEDYLRELGTLSVAQLVARHVEVVGKSPKIKSRPWLVKKLGWIEQTRRFGGLSVAAKRKLEQLMSEIELPIPTPRSTKPSAKPQKSADSMPVGTRIERKWHGRLIVATRVPEGWDCEGHVFKSLSAAAKTVSGSHVSGPAWFGVWTPKEKRQ